MLDVRTLDDVALSEAYRIAEQECDRDRMIRIEEEMWLREDPDVYGTSEHACLDDRFEDDMTCAACERENSDA